jgi:putative sigma-54 modulation protein
MQLELTARRLDLTPTLRRLVATKITKLERLLNASAMSAHVILAREKHRHLTEINLHARGEKFLHAVGAAANWEASLSDAVDKLTQQAAKVKGKWQEGKRASAKAGDFAAAERPPEPVRTPAPVPGARTRPRMPRTLRTSRQAIKAMSVAEAARSIDGRGDGIVVFLDTETAAINVLYRRDSGELTLIEIDV